MAGKDFPRAPRVGVLALQGAVREHAAALQTLGAEVIEVRLPHQLSNLDALILPGGESSTQRRLLDAYGLREPIAALVAANTPMLGTCAGMILLADRIEGEEAIIGGLDIGLTRNAYGRQADSFEADVDMPLIDGGPLHGIFIRAPQINDTGAAVEVLAQDAAGQPLAVRQGPLLATTFHPELSGDLRLHQLLLESVFNNDTD